VAAVLTIIGFSINDTIVIRPDSRGSELGVHGTFREIMNHALNRTLSRTIITPARCSWPRSRSMSRAA